MTPASRRRKARRRPVRCGVAGFPVRAAAALFVSASVGDAEPESRAAGWPQFRRDAALSGTAPAGPGADLELVWSRPLGFSVEGSPAIVGDFVYATALPGLLVKLDLAGGEEVWRYEPGRTDDGGTADFEDDRFGESSPAVASGVVFVGDLLGTLHAVDAESGLPRWTFASGAEIKASPVVVGDRVLVGSYDERFYALDRESGDLLWSVETDGPVHATAAVRDGVAWVTGCDAVLRALRVGDGTEVRRFDSGAYTAASPALGETALFYGTFDNEVLAVEAGTGALRWRYRHPERRFPFYASAALAGDRVVAAGRDKLVHALDRRTGEPAWTFRARARFDASPAVAGGFVYAGNADGRLYVLDLETGEKVSEFHAGGPIMSSPALTPNRLVFGAQDGTLFALGPLKTTPARRR